MQTLSGDPICGALISLIQQQHMDREVEREMGVRVAGEERVDGGECRSSCLLH